MIRRPPRFTLFPYAPLFRSGVAGTVVRPAPARSLIGVVRRVVRTRLVFQIVELIHLPEQRLQAQLGGGIPVGLTGQALGEDRKSTRLNSSHSQISYAVFCLK